jgi:hypothetical protein
MVLLSMMPENRMFLRDFKLSSLPVPSAVALALVENLFRSMSVKARNAGVEKQ